MTTTRQTSLALRPRFGHGGARPGAGRPRKRDRGVERVVAAARTWLLTTGWRRHRLVGVDEVPAAAWA